jgi:outer membrane protein assembly factor BamB
MQPPDRTRPPRRKGRIVYWAIGALLLVFGGLIAYQMLFANRNRAQRDQALIEEVSRGSSAGDRDEQSARDTQVRPSLPWPQWRGPHRDGFVHYDSLRTDWPKDGPPVLWKVKGGTGYSSFAVSGQRVYTVIAPSAEDEALLCLDALKGNELWRRTYPSPRVDYPGPRSTPALDEDGKLLYVISARGRLLCVNTTDGEVKWEVDFPRALRAPTPSWGFACSPLVDGNWAYAITGAPGKAVAKFDRFTGELAWGSQNAPAGYSSPVLATLGGAPHLICLLGDRLVGLAPESGELLWQYPWTTEFKVNAVTPLPIRLGTPEAPLDYVFISSGYRKGCALVKIEKKGERFTARAVYETKDLCCHFGSPVRRGDHLFAPDETRDLTCLDLRTGEVKWRRRGFGKGSVLRINDYLLIFGDGGQLALAKASPEKYEALASARPFESPQCWASPAFADGLLYLRDAADILCLDLRKAKAPDKAKQ